MTLFALWLLQILGLVQTTSSTVGLFDNIQSLTNLCCQSVVYTEMHLALQGHLWHCQLAQGRGGLDSLLFWSRIASRMSAAAFWILEIFVVEPLFSFSAIRIGSTFLAICTGVRLAGIKNSRVLSSKFSNLSNSLNSASMFLLIRFFADGLHSLAPNDIRYSTSNWVISDILTTFFSPITSDLM